MRRRRFEAFINPARLTSPRVAFALAVLATVVWLGVRILLSYHEPPVAPEVHDEFSYLLGADTFLHGRLANPPHPLGRFFESPHVLIRPTYASKYPPGQAAWLAFGIRVFGSVDAALIMQGACLVFTFALLFSAWTRPAVAFVITAVVSVLMLPPNVYWTSSPFGSGAVTAMGAALVLLGLGIFRRTGRPLWPGLLMAFGAVQLFFTRPYEGGVFCVAVLACMPWLAASTGRIAFRSYLRLAVFAAPVLLAGLAFTLYYNHAVTGNALELPYVLHDKTYNATPVFCFAPLRPEPHYDSVRLAAQHGLHGWEAKSYRDMCSSPFWLADTAAATFSGLRSMAWPLFPVLLLVVFGWRDRRCLALTFIALACFASLTVEVWHFSHYMAPFASTFFLLCACLIEYVVESRRLRMGAVLVGGIVLLGLTVWHVPPHRLYVSPNDFGQRRARLIHGLEAQGGQHLIVVHYRDPKVCVEYEWVYNGADIDSQPVVFAHDRGPAEDALLTTYYKNRRKWLLTAHCGDYKLEPLAPSLDARKIAE